MNEELESTNTELQERSIQLNRVKYLPGTEANLQLGVAVLDKELRVHLWNRRAEDLWGAKANETMGQPVLGLDISLPLNELAIPIKKCLSNGDGFQELTVQATNRRGEFHVPSPVHHRGGSMEAAA